MSKGVYPGGYMGKVLHVDLSNLSCKKKSLPRDLPRLFLGGSGVGSKVLYDETGGDSEPLGPQNPLIFMTGPFTGTGIPLSGRHHVITKSPLTNCFGESDVGGRFGTALKKSGHDGVIFRGRAERPTYLWIHDEGVEFRDASDYWGMDTYETTEALLKETDSKAFAACIGPAGENLARISSIMHDGIHARAAGRSGVGAVMGSKNLKAAVALGNREVAVSREEELKRSIAEISGMIVKETKGLHEYGTARIMKTIEEIGDLPIRNWKQGTWDKAENLSGITMAKTMLTGYYYCGACIVGCGREVRVEDGPYAPVNGAGPEYETLATLGALCLVEDLKAVAKAAELCNRYGLDTISTGTAVAFAMECYEHDLIGEKDTRGLKVEWGDPKVMIELTTMIGRREGIGWLLGEGVKIAAEKIGHGAEEFAIHTKGMEFPAHDPRAYYSLASSYATSNRGACHLQAYSHVFERSITFPEAGFAEIQDRFGYENKDKLVAEGQNLMSVMDSLKLCKFILFGGVKATHMVNWLNMVTGWSVTLKEFMKIGERIFNLKRMYNVKCGVSRKDDTLPKRILNEKRGSGGAADNLPPLKKLLDEYYRYRGWDKNGIPTQEKLKQLGLS